MGSDFLIGTLTAGTAYAEYPNHAIRYVLHVSPISATDVTVRKLASVLPVGPKVFVVVQIRFGWRGTVGPCSRLRCYALCSPGCRLRR